MLTTPHLDLFGLQRKPPQNGLTADANQWGEENQEWPKQLWEQTHRTQQRWLRPIMGQAGLK